MSLNQLHFAHPLWLWGGAAIPFVWAVFFLFYRPRLPYHQLGKFIDSHLLPHLLVNGGFKKKSLWRNLLLWSLAWSCLTLAMAGPRWSFREMETFSQDQSLVFLLDLSESMNAADVKPSRLARAKQKIEDILNQTTGVKIGLVAFAADPHMIVPVTEDKETIRHLLPFLDTDLAYVQGSRLSSALDMASTMLDAEPGNHKALLVISDGGFEDATAIITAKKLSEKGIAVHVMGIGTAEGAPVYHEKNIAKKNNVPILSRLEKDRLNEISQAGNGRYLDGHYSDRQEAAFLKELENRADARVNEGKTRRFWDEHFYVMILPFLPILLWWFRRGHLFSLMLILCMPVAELEASPYEYFKNSEELGKQAFDHGDYEEAINAFQDPYRKGVACYRAGKFAEAEKWFSQPSRTDVALQTAYNLGNALVQQQKFKEAITVYEDVLERWPDHIKAKENLELVKKALEQQQQDSNQSENPDKQNEKKPENNNKNGKQDSSGADDKGQSQEDKQQEKEGDANRPQGKDSEPEQNGAEEKQESGMDSKSNREQSISDKQKRQEGKEESQRSDWKKPMSKSQEDQDADLWLNQINNDPKMFLKNKFYIESKKSGTKEGMDPW